MSDIVFLIFLFVSFCLLCFLFPAFLWVTWIFFGISFWFICHGFECISLYRFLVVPLGIYIYIYIKITYHTLVMDFFTISSEVETLPPFIFIYFPHRLKRGRKVYWISSYFCLLCSFFLIFQESFFYYFLSVWRSSSSYSFRVGVMVTNSLKFSSSENVSISLSFLMDIFEGCRILG